MANGPDQLLGTILSELGQAPKRAEKSARIALKKHPKQPDLLFAAGLVAINLGKTREARGFFLKAINTGQARAAAYVNAAIAEADLGAPDKAFRTLKAGQARFPEDRELVETGIKLGITHNLHDTAREWAEAALTRAPDDPGFLTLAALAAEAAGDPPEALNLAERALAFQESDNALRLLSRLCAFTNQPEKALAAARRALALAPFNLANAFDLAWREVENGDFDAAGGHFKQSMADPDLACDALRMLAEIPGAPPADEIAREASALRARAPSQTDLGHLDMALYRAARRAGQADALDHLAAANRHYASDRAYDAAADRNFHKAVLDAFDRADYRPPTREALDGMPRPIFILGMIRTGTTLLDRLVSAAPGIRSLGEVTTTDRFFRAALGTPGASIALDTLVDRYKTMQALAGDANATIDKMPSNYTYIGWLTRAFPDCRVVLMTRDRRDVAVSAFENYFNTQPMSFSFREDWLGQKLDIYDAQIAAWEDRDVAMLKLPYETLVSSPRDALEQVAAFCGIEAVPDPVTAAQPKAIRTASFAQARQGINTGSINRWPDFAPVLPSICKAE